MDSLQILKSSFSQFSRNSEFSRESSLILPRKIVKFESFRNLKYAVGRRSRVCCGSQEGENQSKGEEPPESLFMKELKRRGITPTSLLEDSKQSFYEVEDTFKLKEEDGVFSKRKSFTTNYDKSIFGQRERSMMLNSEGLEGLIPRAKILLTIGGTFFLGFAPLIIITVTFFTVLCLYFGSTFIHDGSDMSISPPPYVDPYQYLEDERISQAAPRLN